MGNPLLDMQVTDGEELLKKYKLNANDAILAGEEQAEMCVLQGFLSLFFLLILLSYDDLVQNYKLTYVAGGASQNAARGAAVSLSQSLPGCTCKSCSCSVPSSDQLRGLHRMCW